jgi:multiple sugar transport system permease protein
VLKNIRFAAWILICSVLGIIFILPFFWMISTSLMSTEQIVKYPPALIPSPITLRSFEYVFKIGNFFTYFKNSGIITLANIFGTLISTTLVAYGFAKYDARLKSFWFALLMSTMMIPYFVTIIPLYNIYANFKLINTFIPLILPNMLAGSAFSVFLLHQFFKTFPKEIEDAARIDGCGEFKILFKVVMPNSQAILFVVAIFMFVWTWNDYFGPIIFLNDQSKYTLAVGLVFLNSSISGYKDALDQGPVMAMSLLSVLPIIIVYSSFQKYFIRGIVSSGLKG